MNTEQPELLIFAGVNGSGKTTFALEYLKTENAKSNIFLNADEIARGLSPLDPASQRIQAGKILLNAMESHFEARRSFAFETTLSGLTYIRRLEQARVLGYTITMFYLHTSSPQTNLARIENRVKEGGHDVPADDVIRRHRRSLENLARNYWQKCDIIYIFNTDKGFNELAYVQVPIRRLIAVNDDPALLGLLQEMNDEIVL